jgi:RNA polymerase sigma factor (sigma-70 family)
MGETPTDRAVWLAQHILPIEPALRRWLSRYSSAGLDTDDVVQETYAILAGLKSVVEIRDPKSYAFKTAQSIILAHLRRSRVVSITAVPDVDFIETIAREPSPETQACDRDELRNVYREMDALPARVRQVFLLRRVDGLSQREVAQRLGISENIVAKCVAAGVQAIESVFKRGRKARPDTPSSGQTEVDEHISPRVPGIRSV